MEWYSYLILAGLVAVSASFGTLFFGFIYRKTSKNPEQPFEENDDPEKTDPVRIFKESGMERTFRIDVYTLPEEDFIETGEETEFDEEG